MQLLEIKVFSAIRQLQYKQLELFVRHKYNLNVITKDGRNGLFVALDIPDPRKRRRMIRFCLDHGIDALQREKTNNYTPVHEAIARQQVDSVQLLLANAGGEIDWRLFDVRGRTILHQAVESNNLPIVEAIVNVMSHFGVSVDIPDKNGLTPYLLAVKLHLRDIAQFLVTKGHASRQQRDLSSHRNADEWEVAGIEEHRLFLRDRLRQEIESAKRKGKISQVNKLKRVYQSPLLSSSKNEPTRRDSLVSATTACGTNVRSTVTINDMIDRLTVGEIPESFVSSKSDEKSFHLESTVSTTNSPQKLFLPSISTARPNQPNVTLNSLVDLFQVLSDQLSSSNRPLFKHDTSSFFDPYARSTSSIVSSRSTFNKFKNNANSLSSQGQRRLSNIAGPTKRVA